MAAATANGSAAVDEGVVFPAEERGYYWIFNTDGIITIVWSDGELGSYSVIAESADAALDFYHGLSF